MSKEKKMAFVLLTIALCCLWVATALAARMLTLPSALKTIADEAFYNVSIIDDVILPNGVKTIGSRAFANSSIASINLPDTLTLIADDAFEGCEGLVVTAVEGSYAYNWAVEHQFLESQSLSISSVRSDVTSVAVGHSVMWVVRASGIKQRAYYRYTLLRDGEVVSTSNYTTRNYFSISPQEPGRYTLAVSCFDNSGITVEAVSEGVNAYSAAAVLTSVVSDGMALVEGDDIVWSFAATQGNNIPSFDVSVWKDNQEIAVEKDISGMTYILSDATAGSYMLRVTCTENETMTQMDSDIVVIYPMNQIYPQAPTLIFGDSDMAFSVSEEDTPVYLIGGISLAWNESAYADSYGLELAIQSAAGWSTLIQEEVNGNSYRLEQAVFEKLTQPTLYRFGIYAQGVRAGEVVYSYFTVEPEVVDKTILVDGKAKVAWDQSKEATSQREFQVTSQLPWTATSNVDWLDIEMNTEGFTVLMDQNPFNAVRSGTITVANDANSTEVSVRQGGARVAPYLDYPVWSRTRSEPTSVPVGGMRFELGWNGTADYATLTFYELEADGTMKRKYAYTTNNTYVQLKEGTDGFQLEAGKTYCLELAGHLSTEFAGKEVETDLLKNLYYINVTQDGHRVLLDGQTEQSIVIEDEWDGVLTTYNICSAYADVDWLEPSIDRNDYASVDAQPNYTTESRTGKVYFTCGQATATLTVTQPSFVPRIMLPSGVSQNSSSPTVFPYNDFTYIATAQTMLWEYQENGVYVEDEMFGFSTSGGIWMNHPLSVAKVDITPNVLYRATATGMDGSTAVYYVKFSSSSSAYVTLDDELSLEWEKEAGAWSETVVLAASGSWTASSDASWLSVSSTSGSSTSAKTLTIKATANTTGSVRYGTITFKRGNYATAYLIVEQRALPNHLTLIDKDTGLVYDESVHYRTVDGKKTTLSLSFYANDDLSLISNDSWLTAVKSGSTSIRITAAENPAGNTVRTGSVTVTAGKNSKTVYVTQVPRMATPVITVPTLSTDETNPQIVKPVDMMIRWNAIPDAVQYQVTYRIDSDVVSQYVMSVSADGSSEYSVLIPERWLDDATTADICWVRIKAFDQWNHEQLSSKYYFCVSAGDAVYIDGNTNPVWADITDLGASRTYTIRSTGTWTAVADQPFIALSKTSGSDGDELAVTVAQNSAGKRNGTVTVSSGTGKAVLSIGQCEVLAEYPSLKSPVLSTDKLNPTVIPADTTSLMLTWDMEPQASYYQLDLYQFKSNTTSTKLAGSMAMYNATGEYTFDGLELIPGQMYSLIMFRKDDRGRVNPTWYYFVVENGESVITADDETAQELYVYGNEDFEYFKVESSGTWSAQTEDEWILLSGTRIQQEDLDENGKESWQYGAYLGQPDTSLCVSVLANDQAAIREGTVTLICGSATAVIHVIQDPYYEMAKLVAPVLGETLSETVKMPLEAMALRWSDADGGTGEYGIVLRKKVDRSYETVYEKENITSTNITIPASVLEENTEYLVYLCTQVEGLEDNPPKESYYFYTGSTEDLVLTADVDFSRVQSEGYVYITAASEGGAGGYRYAYELLKDGSRQLVTEWGTWNSYSFLISEAGEYQVRVYGKDEVDEQTSLLSDIYVMEERAADSISLPQSAWLLDADAQNLVMNAEASGEISVSFDVPWLSCSVDDTVISLHCEENAEVSVREAEAIFSCGQAIAVLRVIQQGMQTEQSVELSQSTWSIEGYHAATQVVHVISAGEWTVYSYPEWMMVSVDVGSGDTDISLYASENTGLFRTGTVVFVGDDGQECELLVSQAGNEIKPRIIEIGMDEPSPDTGDIVTFTVEAENTDTVQFIVDGIGYERYDVIDGIAVISRAFSQGGDRQVQFVPERSTLRGIVSEPLLITVNSYGELESVDIETEERILIGMPIQVSWDAVAHAESYSVYLALNGEYVYAQKNIEIAAGENSAAIEIPVSKVSKQGTYVLIVCAVGNGYNQSESAVIIDVVKPEVDFTFTYPGNNYTFITHDEIPIRISNPSEFNLAVRISVDGNVVGYLPDGNATESGKNIELLYYPEMTSVHKLEILAWPTEIRTVDSMAWNSDKVVSASINVNGPVILDSRMGNGYGNMLLSDAKGITVKTNNAVEKVDVYHQGKFLKTLTEYTETANAVRTFTMPEASIAQEGMHQLKFYAENVDGLIAERTFAFYAVTPVSANKIKYPTEKGVLLRPYPVSPDSASTMLELSEEMIVLGSYGNLAYVNTGSKYGYVDSAKLGDSQLVDWDNMQVHISTWNTNTIASTENNPILSIQWMCNIELPEYAEFQVHIVPEVSDAIELCSIYGGRKTTAEVELKRLEYFIQEDSRNFRVRVDVVDNDASRIVKTFYSKGVCKVYSYAQILEECLYYLQCSSDTLISMHRYFTQGTYLNGEYVKMDLDRIVENEYYRAYATLVDGDALTALGQETVREMYLAHAIMQNLADTGDKIPNIGINESEFKDVLSLIGLDLDMIIDYEKETAKAIMDDMKYIDADGIERIKYDDEKFEKLVDSALAHDDNGALAKKMKGVFDGIGVGITIYNAIQELVNDYVSFSNIDVERLNQYIEAFEMSKNSELKQVAGILDDLKDREKLIVYLATSVGFDIASDKGIEILRETGMSLMPKAWQYTIKGCVAFNNIILNVDEIQKNSYQTQWAIDMADAYEDKYLESLKLFKESPLVYYESFVKSAATFSKLVSMEILAAGDFARSTQEGAWAKLVAFVKGKSDIDLATFENSAELMNNYLQFDIESIYQSHIKEFGIRKVEWPN